MKTSKNIAVLNDFIHYCIAHPEQRFWQALRNWANAPSILIRKEFSDEGEDTFYFEEKDK